MRTYPKSAEILSKNRNYVPGGVVSVNRAVSPEIVFVRGQGAFIWDADGNQYIDYHAAFAPHILGHNDPYVTDAIERVLRSGASLFGSGTTILEGELAELFCSSVPCIDKVQFLNSGSEATYQAIRTARAATGRDHIIVIQGGYNGWHNDVSCNLTTPLEELGPRVSPGEYPYHAISAGVPCEHRNLVHPANFNDLDSIEYLCQKYPIAALITEPILQNIGLVLPLDGYLKGLERLAERFGFVFILDEVKTGFRHSLGGYAEIAGLRPDLVVYGKALANGYPIAALAGKASLMDYFVHPDARRRVLLAGTYNAHPVPVAAAIATIQRLTEEDGAVYRRLESLGAQLEAGIGRATARLELNATFVRQGSAFCLFFMDHVPVDWHDLAANHDFELDVAMRRDLIDNGVYFFPIATKQGSISFAHTATDIEITVDRIASALANCGACVAVGEGS
jgi:glutamate-1-semialdehyde 2,1-aminomutase